ncbi:MAG: SUMF1/EgtB/PvdO family nonheme iron enzyme [Planctomycetota bacterium]|jgi:formylglycine-generating enzyme required for sulfatase activity
MRRFLSAYFVSLAIGLLSAPLTRAAQMPTEKQYTNSIGMKFTRIEAGMFQMGQLKTPLPPELLWIISSRRGGRMDTFSDGDFDERPVHTVEITHPFYAGVLEVTNFQYELFQPEHKDLRGKDNGLSTDDDEAVINVNWYDAQAFCRWLSDKEGLPYRLPTEAEWAYACRAGTTTHYHTGDILPEEFHKNAVPTGGPRPVPLHTGKTPANPWGLYDMHGNVEEWCHEWYGPYKDRPQTDPVGYASGDFRVLRGGSHGTPIYFLRSANRMGALPEDKHWLIGFRVVLGEMPDSKPLPRPRPPLYQRYVIQRDPTTVTTGPDPKKPYFKGPRKYVKIPKEANGPLFAGHNHDPAIVECPNGDLLTVWYTCVSEKDRELGLAASRLRWGTDTWEPASIFFDTPDRNDHAPALGFDDNDTIYHFNGISAGATYGPLALMMRTSKDNGATWSGPRLVLPEHTGGHQPSEPVFWLRDGTMALAVDGPRTLWMSRDYGLTWFNPGGDILGIHTGVTQLADGSILALSRGGDIDKKMPISISADAGKSFTYKASEFAPIGGGQRLALLRLREGPLFLASFANKGITITDNTGKQRTVRGLFGAVSEDGGRTWPCKRLITDDGPGRTIECTDGGAITLSANSAEYRGYLAVCQSTDALIHLISSRNHYAFNLKWLKTSPPPAGTPVRAKRIIETFTGPNDFDEDGWVIYKGFTGGFNGRGQYTVNSKNHFNGLNRVVAEGSFEATFAVRNIRFNPAGKKTPPGVSLGFKDPFSKSMLIQVQSDKIGDVPLASPSKSAKVKFVWNEKTLQWRTFYGVNGDEPITEFPNSKAGLHNPAPLTESTAAMILMSNCSADIDHFEIIPSDLLHLQEP